MSSIRFKTTATASGRTISEVVRSGVRVKYPQKRDGSLTFCVKACEGDKVCSTLNGFERVYEKTDTRLLNRLMWRFGIAVGAVLAVITVIVLSSYLFSISVSGLSRVDYLEVEKFLTEQGICIGSKKSDLDTDALEIALMEKFEFSVVDCKVEGVTLVVSVKEELPQPEYVGIQTARPIVAREDAVITRIVTLSGSVLVKHGQSIKAGDILISPTRKLGDTQLSCPAVGEVHGRVWRKKEIFVPATIVQTERTGAFKRDFCLSFGSLEPEIDSPYEYYEVEKSRVALSDILPFYKNTVTYYECRPIEVENPDLKDLSGIVKGALAELNIQAESEGGIYLDDWYSVKAVDGGVIVRVVCEMEMRIDTYAVK